MSQTGDRNLPSQPVRGHANPPPRMESGLSDGRLQGPWEGQRVAEGAFRLSPTGKALLRRARLAAMLVAGRADDGASGRETERLNAQALPGSASPLRPPGIAMREAMRRAREYHAHPGWYERYGSVGLPGRRPGGGEGPHDAEAQ